MKGLAKDSGLKKINALEVAKQMKQMIDMYIKEDKGIAFEDFKQFLRPHLEKKSASKLQLATFDKTLKRIFDLFDSDGTLTLNMLESGKVDSAEMANMLTLLCGGTYKDKVMAAFILFDDNNSNSLSKDELCVFVKTILKVLFDIVDDLVQLNPDLKSLKGKELIQNVKDLDKLAFETVERCYQDLMLTPQEEVNYLQFMEWMTKKTLFDPVQVKLVKEN